MRCAQCGRTYSLNEPVWRCECGGLLEIEVQPRFERGLIATRKPGLWRYREAIPLENDANIVSFGEGFTPLVEVAFGRRSALVKQDHLFPSGSYKDRGATVLISKMKELGVRECVEDSSGNAGCAVAAYCARAGIACQIYVPADTAQGKLAQILLYGADLVRVPGSREDTAAAVTQAARSHYYASHSWNPWFFQGTKTFAFEVCEQLGWQAPDALVLPAGNGTLLLGAWMGFNELLGAGVIGRLPRLVAVQSSSCAPLYQAWAEGLSQVPAIHKGETLAEGIAIAAPIRGMQIVEAVRKSGGMVIPVGDDEVVRSLKALARQGYYIEPTAAAAAAGLERYLEKARPGEVVVSVFTGHGLKATEKMLHIAENNR